MWRFPVAAGREAWCIDCSAYVLAPSATQPSVSAGDAAAREMTPLYAGVMSTRAFELRHEVLALPPEDRAGLLIDLLDSLDDRPVADDADALVQLWADETARRAGQVDAGEVELDSWGDLMAKVARSRNPG